MNGWIRWGGGAVIALLVLGVAAATVVPPMLDARMNPVRGHASYAVSAEAAALHASIPVADLHADTLLWARDPAERHDRGHTDVPRLRDGGVFLQVFTAVTKSPSGLNYDENDEGASDDITKLAIAQRWPRRTWGSLEERARYQAERLAAVAADDEAFEIVRTRADLAAALARRADEPATMVGVLGTEGAHPLEGDIAAVRRLFDDGYRVMGLQHFFDNALGGSLHGRSGEGLTAFGREAVAEMDRLGIVVDVAHSSEAVVRDVLAQTTRPVIVSHTGLEGHCSSPRNIPDALMAEVASRGGLIGVGYWKDVVCDDSPAGIADAIVYGVEAFGADAIALGSDFDGTVTTALDASELAAITQALMDRGLTGETIGLVMGGNAVRFFAANLPPA